MGTAPGAGPDQDRASGLAIAALILGLGVVPIAVITAVGLHLIH